MQLLVGGAGCRDLSVGFAVPSAARKGELAVVQYVVQQRLGFKPDWRAVGKQPRGGCEPLLGSTGVPAGLAAAGAAGGAGRQAGARGCGGGARSEVVLAPHGY